MKGVKCFHYALQHFISLDDSFGWILGWIAEVIELKLNFFPISWTRSINSVRTKAEQRENFEPNKQ